MTLLNSLYVVVQDGGDDGHHVRFHHPCANSLGPSYTDVDDALKGEIPLPHLHGLFAPALFEDAYQSFNAAIDGENVADAGRGRCEIGEIVQRVDQWQGRGTIERAAVV